VKLEVRWIVVELSASANCKATFHSMADGKRLEGLVELIVHKGDQGRERSSHLVQEDCVGRKKGTVHISRNSTVNGEAADGGLFVRLNPFANSADGGEICACPFKQS
jgi:hypothetical protein